MEMFILRAASTSQLFAHQIIWNMKANLYNEDSGNPNDPMNLVYERIVSKIVGGLSGDSGVFYNRQFNFFNKVTGISGTLKPLVLANASKAEKKVVDELMGRKRLMRNCDKSMSMLEWYVMVFDRVWVVSSNESRFDCCRYRFRIWPAIAESCKSTVYGYV